jgi:hypothetical protein
MVVVVMDTHLRDMDILHRGTHHQEYPTRHILLHLLHTLRNMGTLHLVAIPIPDILMVI